ncbi:hypothetical protein KY310_01945 [Candidatus Woesearchaeota archaeon]|nr:hypothetical protein [Candidatus Woesearchaeota archaeon]
MGEEHTNKWLARIPIYGQFYLAEKLRKAELENQRLEQRRIELLRETADIEQKRVSLEQALKRVQPKLDALDQLKIRAEAQRRDIAVLQKEQESLQERVATASQLATTNAHRIFIEQDKKDRWKQWAHALKEVIQASDVKAEDAMQVVMPHIIDILGLRVLLFNEDEKVNFVTTAAIERLGRPKSHVVDKYFKDLFDCPSINWLLAVGPEYPLLVADTGEEVGAAIAEIPYGVGKTYAIALREPAARQGLVRRLVPETVYAPQEVTSGYRNDILAALSVSAGKLRSRNDVYIDLKSTESVDPELGAWLSRIIEERNKECRSSPNRGTIFLCMPSEKVHRQLRAYNIPAGNIKLPRKTELMRGFQYAAASPTIAFARGI